MNHFVKAIDFAESILNLQSTKNINIPLKISYICKRFKP